MPPKTRSALKSKFDLSPVPLAGFMPPPMQRTQRPVAPSKKPKAVPGTAPAKKSKAATAREIEAAAKTLLKLSRQLK